MTSENAQIQFTVAICTYNGATRVPDVLDCLRWQLKTDEIRWEVIVVDNNSTDSTADVIRQYQTDWPYPYSLRYAFEPKQGAGYARQKAVSIAHGDWIGFLDDDNLPSMLWVYEAFQFAQKHPQVGAFGSRIRGAFSCAIPKNFNRIAPFLALTDRGTHARIYVPSEKVLPPGAGLVVRRQAWVENVPNNIKLGIKVRQRDVAEDLEPILYIQKAGWQIWYNPANRLVHKIPEHRLTRGYLVSLMRGIGLSRYRTRMLSVAQWKRPLMFLAYTANDTRKILRHIVKHGRRTWNDTVTACEMTLYCYSLVSPYYIWQQELKQLWSGYFRQPSGQVTSTDNLV